MSDYDYDLICIGSGPAGQRAAVQAAKLGKRVAVVEKHQWVGGVCVEKGTIPSKTFREAVISYTGYGRRFLPHQENTRGSRVPSEKLLQDVREVVRCELEIVERQLHRNGIDHRRGVASLEDVHTVRIESASGSVLFNCDKILIAVGSKPAQYEGPGLDHDVIVTSDDMPFLPNLPRTMAVIGAGVIGIEYASIFATFGVKVFVVDKRRRLLEFIDHGIVDELIRQMQAAGVVFHLEESVSSIDTVKDDRKYGVIQLESGRRIVCDTILYSAGRIGATDGLHLEKAGLEADSRGRIQVNKFFQTRIPNIYAAGDVIGFPSLAATSSEQGRMASRHAFKGETGGMAEHFPLGIYSVPEVSMVGKTENDLKKENVQYETGIARYSEIARGQILGDDSGLFKMLFDSKTRQLLGVHAIGTDATELIHIGQAVLRLGGGLDYFLHTVFNYPTLAECYKVAALNAENKLSG